MPMLTEIKLNGFASFKHETCLQTDTSSQAMA
jgi:hypothetical protein